MASHAVQSDSSKLPNKFGNFKKSCLCCSTPANKVCNGLTFCYKCLNIYKEGWLDAIFQCKTFFKSVTTAPQYCQILIDYFKKLCDKGPNQKVIYLGQMICRRSVGDLPKNVRNNKIIDQLLIWSL